MSKGESLHDTIVMVASYADLIVMRNPKEGSSRYASEVSAVPVINAGDGANQHPTQCMLDLYSIRKTQGTLENLQIACVGDLKYGRTVHSLVQAMCNFNATFHLVSPQELKLPSSVIKIGNSAFTPGPDFGTIELPDKLQTLGYCPFRADYNQTFEQDTITIPKGLQIRQKMTERVILQNYAVDGKNPYHTASDGLLMSKDGTTLVSVPTGRSGEMYVPDGTLYIDYSAFDECTSITDIYLPDSVMSIGSIGAKNYDTGEYYYTIHCHEGSEAAKKLDAKRIPWVAIE